MKYLKSLLYVLIPTFVFSIILTIIYYFDFISKNTFDWLSLILIILSLFIGGIYIGKNTTNKGYLEGIKLGFMVVSFFFIVSYLAFNISISLNEIIYYVILVFTSTLGSMFGINKKKET